MMEPLQPVFMGSQHTDLYLQWDSHHSMACKFSVINTLTHRARAVCSNSELLKTEIKHIEEAFSHCKYPKWAIDRILHLQQEGKENRSKRKKGNNNTSQTNRRCHIVVPYSQGLCESYKNICSKYGVQVHFKGGNTLENLLIFPNGREAKTKQSNIMYWFKCSRIKCEEEYTEESARTFEERYKEHLKTPSPIFEHENITGHKTTLENFKIIAREGQNMARANKEAIYIRVNNPTLNRNIGKYNLPHIWNKVLFAIPELKTK